MVRQSPEDDMKTMRWRLDRQVESFCAAGAKKVWRLPVEDVVFSVPIRGTARMGYDPCRAVAIGIIRHMTCRTIFVTSARHQRTATMQALASRISDRMTKKAKGGELSA